MKRILFALVVACLFTAAANGAERRPNVLLIMSDDLNNTLGCYGHQQIKTPNVDRLAARGVRFEHAYCAYPLCGPSRNSMLTGLYPNSTGILQNAQIFRQTIPAQPSMPQAFRLAGYFAARIGKLYHYNVPNSIGTNGHDDPGSWEVETNPAGCRSDRRRAADLFACARRLRRHAQLVRLAQERSPSYRCDGSGRCRVDSRALRQANRSAIFPGPGLLRPHTPYVAPKDPYFGYYPEAQCPSCRA